MSVFLVTDDGDDDIQIPKYEHIYQQIKELKYKFPSIESSLSIVNYSKTYHCRRRYRPQQCLVKHLLTYMFTLLFLTNHLHWSIIFFSISSIKFMSTYASTSTTFGPQQSPSIIKEDEQQCFPINTLNIDRICSRICRAQRTPYEKLDNVNRIFLDSHRFIYCSDYTLNHSVNRTRFFNEITENECQQILKKLIKHDTEAQKASRFFVTYMEAIDSASKENRYSIIHGDCLKAYRTWTCSVEIPYFYQNHLVPPCQSICDEVERICPTFRPSDREPLFAGQSLFFCHGGIVTNSDYGQPPKCFDTCHLTDGSFQIHSDSSSSKKSIKDHHTTKLKCSEIEVLRPSQLSQTLLSLSTNDSISYDTNSTSSSSAAVSILSSIESSIIVNSLTFIFVFLLRSLL